MNYYRHPETLEVFAYDGDPLIEGLVRLSDEEVSAHLNPPKSRADVEACRLIAYADPITGSDRYKAEAYAERLAGNESAAVEADAKMLKRREEIRKANPWPEDN